MDVNDVKERLRALAPDEKLRVQSLVEHKIDRFADVFAGITCIAVIMIVRPTVRQHDQ